MTSLTRGPLPARVYWRRRVLVIGTALLLVFAIGRLLIGGSDASSSDDGAVVPAAAPTTGDPTVTVTKKPRRGAGQGERTKEPKREPLPAPTGPCSDEDVQVTPVVDDAVAGSDVFVVLELRTLEAEACTWTASPASLTLKITSGDDDIWASRQCPAAVPTRELVVRREHVARVGVSWSGKRSDDDTCLIGNPWALPGWYHVEAAALAGEPTDVAFELTAPTATHETRTVQPEPSQETTTAEPKRR